MVNVYDLRDTLRYIVNCYRRAERDFLPEEFAFLRDRHLARAGRSASDEVVLPSAHELARRAESVLLAHLQRVVVPGTRAPAGPGRGQFVHRQLVVTHTPAAQKAILTHIRSLRTAIETTIRFECRWVSSPAGAIDKIIDTWRELPWPAPAPPRRLAGKPEKADSPVVGQSEVITRRKTAARWAFLSDAQVDRLVVEPSVAVVALPTISVFQGIPRRAGRTDGTAIVVGYADEEPGKKLTPSQAERRRLDKEAEDLGVLRDGPIAEVIGKAEGTGHVRAYLEVMTTEDRVVAAPSPAGRARTVQVTTRRVRILALLPKDKTLAVRIPAEGWKAYPTPKGKAASERLFLIRATIVPPWKGD